MSETNKLTRDRINSELWYHQFMVKAIEDKLREWPETPTPEPQAPPTLPPTPLFKDRSDPYTIVTRKNGWQPEQGFYAGQTAYRFISDNALFYFNVRNEATPIGDYLGLTWEAFGEPDPIL